MNTSRIYALCKFRGAEGGLPEISRGNADLVGSGTWSPPAQRIGPAPLPIYPAPFDPLFEEIDGAVARIRQLAAEANSLARANGWGSAGKYPASQTAKTPAAREQVCADGANDLPTSPRQGVDVSACASAQRPTREAIV